MPFNVNDFIQATKDGFAREAHFEAQIQLPRTLSGSVISSTPEAEIARRTLRPDLPININIDRLTQPTGQRLADTQDIRKLSFLCSAATLPGRRLRTVEVNRYGMGFFQPFATGTQYDSLTLEFYCDAKADNLKLLHTWMDSIYSFQKKDFMMVEYSDNYTSTMDLIQYDTQGKKISSWKFFDLFPEALPPINFSWAARGSIIMIQAVFGYSHFEQYPQPMDPTVTPSGADGLKTAQTSRIDRVSNIF